jgi:hypothetical protein
LAPTRVTVGDRATFEIELSKGDARSRWRKNGGDLKLDSTRMSLRIDGKVQRLEISDVRMEDAGQYSCAIVGADECSAALEVEEPRVDFVEKPGETVSGDYGKDLKIEVLLSKPNVAVEWQKDGQKVETSEKLNVESDGAARHWLTVRRASLSDLARYACVAENVRVETELELLGGDEAIAVAADVLEQEGATERVVTKGQDVTFEVPFVKPMLKKPEAEWTVNGKVLQANDKVRFTRKADS